MIIISKSDRKIISNQLKLDFNLKLDDIIEDKEMFIIENPEKKNVYIIESSKSKLINSLPSREIKHFGILIGTIRKEHQFDYHFELLDFVKKLTIEKTLVDSKGEQTTLYGRNITKKMIKKVFSKIKSGKKTLIINKYEDVLGLGKFLLNQENFDKIEDKKVVLKNIIDKGWFLRKGG